MSAEARDALAVAPLGPLVDEARANHVRWQHEAEYLEECGRELCIGAKLLLWPDIENPRDSIPLPDGWVLARREDAEDGVARDALALLIDAAETLHGSAISERLGLHRPIACDVVGECYVSEAVAAARKATDALGGVG